MKKLFLALVASISILGAAAQTTTKTYFAGERITGVSASSGFEVILVQSNQTKAVVEVSEEIESYIRVGQDYGGIVTVGVKTLIGREQKEFQRLRNTQGKKLTMRLTLYLPTLNTIRLSSSASIRSADTFGGDDLDVMLSSSAAIRGDLKVASKRVKVQGSSSSKIENLIMSETTDLTVVLSSSARAAIAAPKLTYSKVGVSSSASLNITGAAKKADWTVSSSGRITAEYFTIEESNFTASSGANMQIEGMGDRGKWNASSGARIFGENFRLKDLTATSSSGASMRVNVSGTLSTQTSSGASILYNGSPIKLDDRSSGVRPL